MTKLVLDNIPAGQSDEPLEFEWRGQTWHARQPLPARFLVDITERIDRVQKMGGKEKGMGMVQVIGEFFDVAIVPEELEEFSEFLLTAQPSIGMEELGSAMSSLMASLSAVPTKPVTSSPSWDEISSSKSTDTSLPMGKGSQSLS